MLISTEKRGWTGCLAKNIWDCHHLIAGITKIPGEIEIISERAFCDNCKVLVDMFEKEFPNIKVIRVQIVK